MGRPCSSAARFLCYLSGILGGEITWRSGGVAITGKLGGLFGSGATPGTNQLTTLSGTKTVGSAPELATEGALGAIEKIAPFAMGAATVADIVAHGTCAMMADSAAANAALQSVP